MFLGSTNTDPERPTPARRTVATLIPKETLERISKLVVGRVIPLDFWHDENIIQAEEYLMKSAGFVTVAAELWRHDIEKVKGLRARLRAVAVHASKGVCHG
jgi:hypothetical protein